MAWLPLGERVEEVPKEIQRSDGAAGQVHPATVGSLSELAKRMAVTSRRRKVGVLSVAGRSGHPAAFAFRPADHGRRGCDLVA